MADYMTRGADIYENGAGSRRLGKRDVLLDKAVLDRWAKYLKPTKERRVHLEAWYSAGSGRRWKLTAKKLSNRISSTSPQNGRGFRMSGKQKPKCAEQRGESTASGPEVHAR